MANIYKIVNSVNEKVYVGNTSRSLKKRWQEHLRNATDVRTKDRPLYRAMNEYGTECFSVELIEKCPNEISEERETFWISYYDSYVNGYNATYGGAGKPMIDVNEVLSLWAADKKNIKEISKSTQRSIAGVSKVLHKFGVSNAETRKRASVQKGLPVVMIGSDGSEIREFASAYKAAEFLGKPCARQHIAEVCKGLRKTACKYRWKFKEQVI